MSRGDRAQIQIIHARVDEIFKDVLANPGQCGIDILKIIRGDMNEIDKMAIAAGLSQMSEEDRAAFKAGAGEIVDILESTFLDNKGVDMHRTEEIIYDGDKTTLTEAGIKPPVGDVPVILDKGPGLLKSDGNEPYVVRRSEEALVTTDADAIGVTVDARKVGMIAHSKNSAGLMKARQPGANIDLTKAIASAILSPINVDGVKAVIDRQYHPAVEHVITSAKSKHFLNAAAGWSMMNPAAHQFIWVEFYGDATQYTIERANRNYGVLQFTLSDQRVINVGSIDRQNTALSLQNPKIKAIGIKSSRRY